MRHRFSAHLLVAAVAVAPILRAQSTPKEDPEFAKSGKGELNLRFDTYAQMRKEPKGTKCDWVFVAPGFSLEELRKAEVNVFMRQALQNAKTGGTAEMVQVIMEGLAELGVKGNPADTALSAQDEMSQAALAEFAKAHPGVLEEAGMKAGMKAGNVPAAPASPKPEAAPGFNLVIYSLAAEGTRAQNNRVANAFSFGANYVIGEIILLKDGKPILAARHTAAASAFGNPEKKCGKALVSAIRFGS